MIRTAQVAKHLGISPRELREDIISKVNFGVKPTDREIPFSIAAGIVRYAARMLKIACGPLEESLEEEIAEEEISAEKTEKNVELSPEKSGESFSEKREEPKPHSLIVKKEDKVREMKRAEFSTLEKLRNIGTVSQGDVERLKREAEEKKKREEEERKKREEMLRLQREKPAQKNGQATSSGNANGGGPKVMRKIEISAEEAESAKKKKEEKDAERKRRKEKEEEAILERRLQRGKRQDQIFTKKEGVVMLSSDLSVKEFSEKIGIPLGQVITTLLKNGMMVTLNQSIDFETACLIAEELGVEVKREEAQLSSEDILKGDLTALLFDESENLVERPPVVAVVGHVDHGKTSILDAIRKAKVVDGESGGITQHIGAYSIVKNGRNITFLDTPGHEAFTSMRARGAKTADVVILVVAADDSVKPQTIEAIQHAKSAGVAIVVAANKMDKPAANLDKVRADLAEHGIVVEDWGGTVPLVPVSAHTKMGMDDLLDIVLLQADLLELKANPKRLAVGTVVEAHKDPALGPVATILINTGTLNVRDFFILGDTGGRVKTMINDEGKRLKDVPPSCAARISGIDHLPNPGDIFQVVANEKEMKRRMKEMEDLRNSEKKSGMGMMDLVQSIRAGEMKTLNLVVKADTTGSLEAIEQALSTLGNNEVKVKVVHAAVGNITENDVLMAGTAKGLLIGFHTHTPSSVKNLADKEGVDIRDYSVIYNLTDEMFALLEGMLEPEKVETITGYLKVKGVFYTKGKKKIIGGKVENGYLEHPCRVRIFRGEEILGEANISAIQHFEEKLKKIESPQECGLQMEGFTDEILEGDRIEGFKQEMVIRKLTK